jgi:hydroxymethylbilane synthase
VTRLRLGTRGSPLALRQAHAVAAELERAGVEVALEIIRTSGDAWKGSLAAVGGKGLFTKELEDALRERRIDLAIHSLKDVPAILPPDLALIATPVREDPRDVLIAAVAGGIADLPAGARLGTSSLRRRAQLLARRRDLVIAPLRGNVETRLEKLARGEVDALVLAAAGLRRLGLAPAGARVLTTEEFLPAIGQGALAIEARAEDAAVRDAVAPLNDAATATCVAAERAFLAAVGGDCHTPLAASTTLAAGRLSLRALVAELDGSAFLTGEGDGSPAEAEAIGRRLAAELLGRGAAAMIARAHGGGS